MRGDVLQELKKQNFLKGAAILAAASIFVKIVGAIYKIPLFQDGVLGDVGTGAFQVTYSVYALILSIATAGIPVALSRMVSAAAARGSTRLVRRYFSVALPSFMLIGIVAMLVMFLFADGLSGLMNNRLAAPGIQVLAPAVFFACIISVYRGYAQGFENMIPTAVSQIVEVICKMAIGLAVAMWFVSMSYEPHIVSAGAITGVTIGLGLCVPPLVWYKRKLDRGLGTAEGSVKLPSGLSIFGSLMKVSIPITLSASFMSIMAVIDNSVVLGRLQSAFLFTEEEALALFGVYTRGLTIYNLPPALIVPVAVSIIPAIAAALAKEDKDEAGSIMRSSIKLHNLLAMPACAGVMVLAGPILLALYNESRENAVTMLIILGAASFFVCLQHITMAILQANGHERIAMLTFPVGAVLRIMLSYFLVGNPNVGIVGTPIGNLACFMVISALNIVFIMTRVKHRPKLSDTFLKPLLCTAAMAAAAYLVYELVYRLGYNLVGAGRFAVSLYLAAAIFAAVIVYVILVIVTRTVTMEDMKLVPKGEKLAEILRIK